MKTAVAYDYAAQPKMELPGCPVCNGTQGASREFVDRFGFTVRVHQCPCGLMYLNPRLTEEAYAEFYQHHYRNLLSALPVYRHYSPTGPAALAARVERGQTCAMHLRAAGIEHVDRLLDVGGSTGHFAVGLAKELPVGHVTVLDPNRLELEQASRCGFTVVEGTAEQGPDLGTFDGLICAQTCDHWCRPLDALRWMRARLAPGGWMAIDIVDAPAWGRKYQLWKVDHPLYWSPASLKLALMKTGWRPRGSWRSHDGLRVAYLCKGV